MNRKLRWGILGTGNIAKQFAGGLQTARRSEVVAVGSRTNSSAEQFARDYQIRLHYGSYDALIRDPAVDVIYLSLPNSLHHEWTIKSLRAGKHVLCEKPFAMDLMQSQEMFDVAQKTGKVLMEAFMYRCHPQTRAIVDAVHGGKLGKLQLIRANFCYRTTKIEGNVRWVKELGGGALMDVGCYCTSFARLVAGAEPEKIHAVAQMHESGIDEVTAITMQFPDGAIATLSCGMSVQADNTAYVCGTEGWIETAWPWKPQPGKGAYTIARAIPPRQDLKSNSAPATPPRETIKVDVDVDLYALEADHFAESVFDGKALTVSLADTLGNMRVIDEVRKQIGLHW
jgi:predicted dehydrogenase